MMLTKQQEEFQCALRDRRARHHMVIHLQRDAQETTACGLLEAKNVINVDTLIGQFARPGVPLNAPNEFLCVRCRKALGALYREKLTESGE